MVRRKMCLFEKNPRNIAFYGVSEIQIRMLTEMNIYGLQILLKQKCAEKKSIYQTSKLDDLISSVNDQKTFLVKTLGYDP